MTVGEVKAKLILDLSNFRSGLQRANTLIEQHRERALKASAILMGLGGALASGMIVATREAAAFEAQMRNVNSILKASEDEFAALSKSVLALAGKTGQAPAILARGLYDIASSGFAGAEGLKILEAAAIGATAGMTDTATAARAVTGVLNAYGMSADEAAHVQDILFKTVERGVVTYGDLAQNLGEVTAMAAQAKVPLEEVGAAIATLTLAGLQPAEAVTSLNRVIQSFISPAKQAKDAAAALGVDMSAAALASKGLSGVMREVARAAGTSGEELAELAKSAQSDAEFMEELSDKGGSAVEMLNAMFPEIRSFRGAVILAADGGRVFSAQVLAMADATGAAASAFAEQSKSFQVQWAKAINGARAALVQFGASGLPVLKAFGWTLAQLVRLTEAIPGPLRSTIAIATLLGAAVFGLAGAFIIYNTHIKEGIGLIALWMAGNLKAAAATQATKAAQMSFQAYQLGMIRSMRTGLVATNAMTLATGRLGGALRLAGIQMKALWTSLGPIGWAVLAVIGLYTAWSTYSEHVKKAAAAAKQQAEQTKKQAEQLGDLLAQLKAVNAELAKQPAGPAGPSAALGTKANELLEERQRILNEMAKITPRLFDLDKKGNAELRVRASLEGEVLEKKREALATVKEEGKAAIKAAEQRAETARKEMEKQRQWIELLEQPTPGGRKFPIPLAEAKTFQDLGEAYRLAAAAAEAARKSSGEMVKYAEDMAITEQQRADASRKLSDQRAAGIERERGALVKLGVDAATLADYVSVRTQHAESKAAAEVKALWADVAEARGDSYEATLRRAAATYEEETKAADLTNDQKLAAFLKLQAELTKISREETAARAQVEGQAVQDQLGAWIEMAGRLRDANLITTAEYIEQLARMGEAAKRFNAAREAAGLGPIERVEQMQLEMQRTALQEQERLEERLHTVQEKLHQERLQWTEQERAARASLYEHEMSLLDLTRRYALDMLKVRGADTERALGEIERQYLSDLAAARPAEDLGPEQMSAWAERMRQATIGAWEEGLISQEEALERLTEARDAATAAEEAAADADKAAFEARRIQHEQTMAMLSVEQKELGGYIERATKALADIFKGMADSADALRRAAGAALQARPLAVAAVGGPRVGSVNITINGRMQTAGPRLDTEKLLDVIEEGLGLRLEREQQHPRN